MNFESMTLAEVQALSPPLRTAYERWFSAWMASGFRPSLLSDTFDIETERRDGWGYQLAVAEPHP